MMNKFKLKLVSVIKLLLTILCIPLAIVIRAIKPIIHIRFGKLISDRIGHLAFEPEMYLCEKDMKIQQQGTVDLFYCYGPIANTFLLKMWRTKFKVLPRLIMPLDWANRILPYASNHLVPLHSNKHEDILGLLNKLPPHLELNSKENLSGQKQLRSFGVPDGAKFICFHARDSAYLNKWLGGNSEHHNYRDSNIHNYLLAAQAMVKKGYFMIRMGAIVGEPLEVDNPMIIDYASKYRTDFMDIFLLSRCAFFIAANSGPCAIATIFRRPNAFVNVAPFMGVSGISRTEDLFIPKKPWSVSEKRFLTFDEILKNGVGSIYYTEQFSNDGIELIENSPEEICALVTEMEQRQKGTWEESEEELNLQEMYSAILNQNGCDIRKLPRIGTAFLHQHKNLLG